MLIAVMGHDILTLVMGARMPAMDRMDSDLRSAGFPPIDDWDNEDVWAEITDKGQPTEA